MLGGDLLALRNSLTGQCSQMEVRLSSQGTRDRKRGKSLKMCLEVFRQNIEKKKSSTKGWSNTGKDCPGQWWSHQPWKHLKDVWMRHLGTWVSGELGGVKLMAGPGHLGGLFQP